MAIVFEKPLKFEESHFKRLQQNLWFLLNLKKVVNALTNDIFVVPFGSTEQTNCKNTWIHIEHLTVLKLN